MGTRDEGRDDEAINPFAAPADDEAPREIVEGAPIDDDFVSERRSVPVVVVLTLVTFGLYIPIWLYRRRPFLDALGTHAKLGSAIPVGLLGLFGLNVVLGAAGDDAKMLSNLVSGVAAIVDLVARFRVAAILRQAFRNTGRRIDVSGVATFFFGIWYLQAKMNAAALTPGRVVRRRKKKKMRKPSAEAA